jgi:hypothetical protein
MTITGRRYFFFAGALLLLLLFLCQSDLLTSAAREALAFSANVILPTLFPFLVLSGLLTEASRGIRLPGGQWFRRLLRIPEEGMLAFFLGALCGFPIGVKVTVDLYRAGALTKDEAARLAALSANTGPGFVIAGIGSTLFGDATVGALLYAIQLGSALLLALIQAGRTPPLPPSEGSLPQNKEFSFTDLLYRASLSLLGITGITVFFGVLAAFPARLLPPPIAAFLTAILEVGNGTKAAAALPLAIGFPVSAFAVSFSGISVLMQSASLLSPEKIPISPLILRKLLQGVLSLLLALTCGSFIF